jgi:preprotein translocase subunit SecA
MAPTVEQIRAEESRVAAMSNQELSAQTGIFKLRIGEAAAEARQQAEASGQTESEIDEGVRLAENAVLEEILPQAFSVVRETAKRATGMRPYDVQMIGGITLHRGAIAEMVTGEGKTLVATMPAYLNALTGRGVHIITVNDFLARRDCEWMRPIYEFLGLTVGLVQHDMATGERQVGYRSDITYGTNNEFGFDYLRDNMAVRPEMRVQRALNYAIIDEVDSILIDEARTPLIIAGRPEKATDVYYKVDEIVRRMRRDTHYELEEKGNHVLLSEEGMELAEKMLGVDNLFTDESIGVVHMIEQSIRAHNFFKHDDEYVVRDGEVIIVDEFTGRLMEGRRYSDGLHQAIEAKERVAVQFESQTVASITYQNLFRLYNKISGMTGTAVTEAGEFATIYDLDVISIPTHFPLVRADQTDLVFATEDGKFRRVVEEIRQYRDEGRPVLVGTVSIEKSEKLAGMLKQDGVDDFEVLNAKYHEREAAIIANAGKRSAITIATNMAGRGTDIKLAEGVRELGGLAIVGTERHESRRIDNQLRGRCGRQGDPGTTRFYVSLEDEVARLFGGDKVKRLVDFLGSDQMDDEPLSQRMVTRSIERAQRQVEEYNFEIRKHLKEYDDVMDRQRRIVYEMRREVLEDEDISARINEMFENIIDDAAEQYAPKDEAADGWDMDGLSVRMRQVFAFEPRTEANLAQPRPLADDLLEQVRAEYARREQQLTEEIRQSYREQIGGDESAIDFAKLGRRRIHDYELMALLRAVDEKWIDHLYSMDYLRESVRLRAYGQRDPLVEYKAESFELFENMLAAIEESVVQTVFRLTDPEVRRARQARAQRGAGTAPAEDPFAQLVHYSYVAADKEQDRSFASFDTSRFALAGQQDAAQAVQGAPGDAPVRPKRKPIRIGIKVKPNDPCTCGSGKKFKKCCGAQLGDE